MVDASCAARQRPMFGLTVAVIGECALLAGYCPWCTVTVNRGYLKTQIRQHVDSDRTSRTPLRRFLGVGNGKETLKNIAISHFYTAWTQSRRRLTKLPDAKHGVQHRLGAHVGPRVGDR